MSSGVNRVILVGRLGADPDLRTTQTGQNVCTLSLATSETWVKDGKREDKTEWHRVILWARQAELAAKYLKKGRMVYIEGRLQTRSWQDNQGQKRYTTEIVATTMQFLEGQSQSTQDNRDSAPSLDEPQSDSYYSNSASFSPSAQSANGAASRSLDDDIPF